MRDQIDSLSVSIKQLHDKCKFTCADHKPLEASLAKEYLEKSYSMNYRTLRKSYYFKELNPSLKHKLIEIVVEKEKQEFKNLFYLRF
jgi:hypothetical protein